jgi:hypothetical protein
MLISPINYLPIELSYYIFILGTIIYSILYIDDYLFKWLVIIVCCIVSYVHFKRFLKNKTYILNDSNISKSIFICISIIIGYTLFIVNTSNLHNTYNKKILMLIIGLLIGYGLISTYFAKEKSLKKYNISFDWIIPKYDIPLLLSYTLIIPFIIYHNIIWMSFLVGDMFYHIYEIILF